MAKRGSKKSDSQGNGSKVLEEPLVMVRGTKVLTVTTHGEKAKAQAQGYRRQNADD